MERKLAEIREDKYEKCLKNGSREVACVFPPMESTLKKIEGIL